MIMLFYAALASALGLPGAAFGEPTAMDRRLHMASALKREDQEMAAHLRQEGFTVLDPK